MAISLQSDGIYSAKAPFSHGYGFKLTSLSTGETVYTDKVEDVVYLFPQKAQDWGGGGLSFMDQVKFSV